jgi:hypothetical protein
MSNYRNLTIALAVVFSAIFSSCEKSYMQEVDALAPKVYLTSVDQGQILLKKNRVIIPPDSTMIRMPLGVARSGTQPGQQFLVSLTTSVTDIGNGNVPLPSSVLSQTEVDVPQNLNKGLFSIDIPMTLVKQNLGKKLAIRLSISNSTKYDLNPLLSSALVVLDVNDFFAPPPPSDPLPKYVIIDEALRDGWGNWGWSKEVDYSSLEQKKKGLSSAKVTYTDAWGGFQLHAPGDLGLDLTGYSSMKISIFTTATGDNKDIKLWVNEQGSTKGEKTLTLKGGTFTTFQIPLSELGNPASISDIVIQNQGTAELVMYIDDFGFN